MALVQLDSPIFYIVMKVLDVVDVFLHLVHI